MTTSQVPLTTHGVPLVTPQVPLTTHGVPLVTPLVPLTTPPASMILTQSPTIYRERATGSVKYFV